MDLSARSPARVLIADDDVQARDENAAFLRAHTHDVVVADARTIPERAIFDGVAVLVADVTVEEDLADAWLEARPVGGLPIDVLPRVIFTTSRPSIPAAVRAMRTGAFDYLPKPFALATLLERVREALPVPPTFDDVMPLEDVRREAIRQALHRAGGNVMLAAVTLGVPRSTLYQHIHDHGLTHELTRPSPRRSSLPTQRSIRRAG